MDVTPGDGFRRLWSVGKPRPGGPFDVIGVVTSRDGSEMVLPLRNRRTAAVPLIRHTADQGAIDRLIRRLAWVVVRGGASWLLPIDRHHVDAGPESLHAWLSTILGHSVVAAASFGPPRPNRKPVLRIMTADGTCVAFAKVGWNDFTRELVNTEAAYLGSRHVSDSSPVRTPRLLHLGDWSGLRVAVYSPLLGRPGRSAPSATAFSAVSGADPAGGMGRYLADLDHRISSVPGSATEAAAQRLSAWRRRWAGIDLATGRWHGDWTPWNMAPAGKGGIVVWDWERTRAGVPVGFDVLHFHLQPLLLRSRVDADRLLATTVARSAPLLTGMGVSSPAHRALAHLYVTEIMVRHADRRATSPDDDVMVRLAAATDGIDMP